jgi:hypothetical protein
MRYKEDLEEVKKGLGLKWLECNFLLCLFWQRDCLFFFTFHCCRLLLNKRRVKSLRNAGILFPSLRNCVIWGSKVFEKSLSNKLIVFVLLLQWNNKKSVSFSAYFDNNRYLKWTHSHMRDRTNQFPIFLYLS